MAFNRVTQNGSKHNQSEPVLDQNNNNPSFVLQEHLRVSIEERPVPVLSPGSNDVIVQIKKTGICGSDVHYYAHGSIGKFVVKSPMVLGHESSGIVAAVGSACKTLRVGDRVALEPGVPCRQCTACKVGKYNICDGMAFAATPPFDGTLCKYYKLAEDFCYQLPDHISFEEGALVEPLAVAVHICRRAKIVHGSSVVIFGAGPVGLLCSAVARAFGATTIVSVDLLESRLKYASNFYGATHTRVASKGAAAETAAQIILEAGLNFKGGADIAIDASGAEPSVQTGGMGKYDISFPIGAIIEKELDVKGSFRYGSGDYDLAISLLSSKSIDLERLITGRYEFHDAERAFGDVYSNTPGLIKVVIGEPEAEKLNGVIKEESL